MSDEEKALGENDAGSQGDGDDSDDLDKENNDD
jgi:hypothetical protein